MKLPCGDVGIGTILPPEAFESTDPEAESSNIITLDVQLIEDLGERTSEKFIFAISLSTMEVSRISSSSRISAGVLCCLTNLLLANVMKL